MNINELTGGAIPAEDDGVIVNPNLLKERPGPTEQVQSVDPVQLRGLKTQADIDAENAGTEFDKAIDLGYDYLKKQKEENEVFKDTVEQTQGELDSQAVTRMFGFDPLAAMQAPPDPSRPSITEASKASAPSDSIPVVTETEVKQQEIREEVKTDDESEIEKEMASIPAQPVTTVQEAKEVASAAAVEIVKPEQNMSESIPEVNQSELDEEMKELDAELSKADDAGSSLFTEDERSEYMKQDIRSKIKPIVNKFDISSFTVVNKPVLINRTLEKATETSKSQGRVADWALPSTKRKITVTGLLGTEISDFTSRSSRNDVENVRARFNMLYAHDITPGKAETMEQWAKSINRNDYDHIFAAYYRACFENSNFIAYQCDNDECQSPFLSDNTPFSEVVKYKDEAARKTFNDILNDKFVGDPSAVAYEITPVSDVYAFSFKDPSLWDSFIKPAYVDNEFINKYSNAFAVSTFVDKIYYIDAAAGEIRPLDLLNYPNNIAKTEKAKIMVIAKILATLSSDQYSMLLSIMGSIGEDKTGVSYVTPEIICPRCGHKIEEQPIAASNLLFLRHQLAMLANG